MMSFYHFCFDKRNHHETTAKSNRSDTQEDRGEGQEQRDFGKDWHRRPEQDTRTNFFGSSFERSWFCLELLVGSSFGVLSRSVAWAAESFAARRTRSSAIARVR